MIRDLEEAQQIYLAKCSRMATGWRQTARQSRLSSAHLSVLFFPADCQSEWKSIIIKCPPLAISLYIVKKTAPKTIKLIDNKLFESMASVWQVKGS